MPQGHDTAWAPVSIGDRHFVIEAGKHERVDVPIQRDGIDTGRQPSGLSLANREIWPRQGRSWTLGAGQLNFDEATSNANTVYEQMFHSSFGVNPWTQRQLFLHNDTANGFSTTTVNDMVATDEGVWIADGTALRFSTTGTGSWTLKYTAPQTIRSLTTDGHTVYGCSSNLAGSGNVFSGTSASVAQTLASPFTLIEWANSRLFASNGNVLYELISGATATSTIYTHPSSAASYKAIVGAPNGVYAAATIGLRSELFYLTIVTASGAISAPIRCGEIPFGEQALALTYYGGMVIIGTTKGIRIAQISGSGFLSHGPLLALGGSVISFASEGEYVWFNHPNTGVGLVQTGYSVLGRLRLARFTEPLVASYASDLAFAGAGGSSQVVRFGGRTIYYDNGNGIIYEQLATPRSTGFVTTGLISYDAYVTKELIGLEILHQALTGNGTIVVDVTTDNVTTTGVLTSNVRGATRAAVDVSGQSGETFELKLTINKDTTNNASPVLTRWTTHVLPKPFRAEKLLLPVVLMEVTWRNKRMRPDDSDLDYLLGLFQTRQRVKVKLGRTTYTGVVDGVQLANGEASDWVGDLAFVGGIYNVVILTQPSFAT